MSVLHAGKSGQLLVAFPFLLCTNIIIICIAEGSWRGIQALVFRFPLLHAPCINCLAI